MISPASLFKSARLPGFSISAGDGSARALTTREAISQLESKIRELEQRLKETTQVYENPEPAKETIPETPEAREPSEEVTPEIVGRVSEEPEEDVVTVTALEDAAAQQEHDENLKKQSEKKRRKIF